MTKKSITIQSCYADQNYDLCLKLSDDILEKNPSDFDALSYKGACLGKLGQQKEAIKILTKSILVRDDVFFIYVFRGDNYYDIEEYEDAADDYKKAIELDPDNGAVMDKCARSLFRIGEAKEALAFIKKAVELEKSPEPIIIMGNMLKRLGLKHEEFKTMSLGASVFPEDKRFDDYRN